MDQPVAPTLTKLLESTTKSAILTTSELKVTIVMLESKRSVLRTTMLPTISPSWLTRPRSPTSAVTTPRVAPILPERLTMSARTSVSVLTENNTAVSTKQKPLPTHTRDSTPVMAAKTTHHHMEAPTETITTVVMVVTDAELVDTEDTVVTVDTELDVAMEDMDLVAVVDTEDTEVAKVTEATKASDAAVEEAVAQNASVVMVASGEETVVSVVTEDAMPVEVLAAVPAEEEDPAGTVEVMAATTAKEVKPAKLAMLTTFIDYIP